MSGARLEHQLGHVLRILWGMSGSNLGHVWDLSGASSAACLGNHLGHVWGIILGMSLACLWNHLMACLEQSNMSVVSGADAFLLFKEYENIKF